MTPAPDVHRSRRTAILATMREHAGGGLALVPTAPEVIRNRDSYYPYRSDSYFHYLSGFPEPEAVVALVAGPDGDRHVLFCREKNEEREIWDGFRYGPDAAKDVFGFDEAYSIAELDAKLPDFASDRPALSHAVGLFDDLGPQGDGGAATKCAGACAPGLRRPSRSWTSARCSTGCASSRRARARAGAACRGDLGSAAHVRAHGG